MQNQAPKIFTRPLKRPLILNNPWLSHGNLQAEGDAPFAPLSVDLGETRGVLGLRSEEGFGWGHVVNAVLSRDDRRESC